MYLQVLKRLRRASAVQISVSAQLFQHHLPARLWGVGSWATIAV